MSSNYILYIPDLVAMLVLMAVLVFLRRRSHAQDVTLWLVGLSFIFIEAVAADLNRFTSLIHKTSHAVALDAYVLAGLTFAWVARKESVRVKDYLYFCLATVLPLLTVSTLYGMGSKQGGLYSGAVVVGIVLELACTFVLLRTASFMALVLALQAITWGPMLGMVSRSGFREANYWGLGCLYLLVAVALWSVRRRSTIGGTVMISGFVLYSLCLFTHPYLRPNSVAALLNDQIWTLQKFFVTIGLLLVLLDEQSRRNEELALLDPLTGLPNRRLFDDRMSQAIQRAERYRTKFALFTIDLNGFKAVNDALGHRKGDEVLRETASRLSQVVRSADTLARCGGDEFFIIMNNVAGRELCDLMEVQLQAAFLGFEMRGFELQDFETELPVALTGSVGYALYPDDASDGAMLQEIADRRMYLAKRLKNDAAVTV